MKRLISFVVIGLILGGMAAFADDAKVMPARVGRVYVAPAFAFANASYDDDGEYKENKKGLGDVQAFNLGFALEYGVTDWITAALQWAPGVTIWSDIDQGKDPLGRDIKAQANGVYDLFAGAKLQIVGENAPLKSSMFRAAIAPGVKIPFPGHDFKDEMKNMNDGDAFNGANADKHVFGLGARGYFDYIINENFYINLFAEIIAYPAKQDLKKDSLTGYGQAQVLKALGAKKVTVDYGYDFTFEIEPHFDMQIADGLSFSAGLPFRMVMTPGIKYSKENNHPAFGMQGLPALNNGDDTLIGTLAPNVQFFLTSTPIPLEFKATYTIPLFGRNEMAMHNVNLQIKVYFAIPGGNE